MQKRKSFLKYLINVLVFFFFCTKIERHVWKVIIPKIFAAILQLSKGKEDKKTKQALTYNYQNGLLYIVHCACVLHVLLCVVSTTQKNNNVSSSLQHLPERGWSKVRPLPPPNFVLKWILSGYFKPSPNATIKIVVLEVIYIRQQYQVLVFLNYNSLLWAKISNTDMSRGIST